MRFLALAAGAAAALLLCPLHPQHIARPADPLCVTIGPLGVMDQQILPAITQCPP